MRQPSNKKVTRIPMWARVAIPVALVAVICLGAIPIISYNKRQETIKMCQAKVNTIQSTEARFDEENNQIIVTLDGFSTSYETPIVMDGSVMTKAKNELDSVCHQVGVNLYKVNEQVVIPDCSVKTIGFQADGKLVKENMDIESACLQYKWHYEEIKKLCSVKEGFDWLECMIDNGLGSYYIVREY